MPGPSGRGKSDPRENVTGGTPITGGAGGELGVVILALTFWLVAFIAVGTLLGAIVGIRRDVGRIADVLERTYDRGRVS